MIWFNIQEAREFLLKNGFVYTLRPRKKRNGLHKLMARGVEGKHVEIQLVKELDMTKQSVQKELEGYVSSSGFKSVDEWINHVPKPRKVMYLYYVKEVDLNA